MMPSAASAPALSAATGGGKSVPALSTSSNPAAASAKVDAIATTRREADSEASSGTTTNQMAANEVMPPLHSAHVVSSLSLTGLVARVAWCSGGITSFAAIWLVVVPLDRRD